MINIFVGLLVLTALAMMVGIACLIGMSLMYLMGIMAVAFGITIPLAIKLSVSMLILFGTLWAIGRFVIRMWCGRIYGFDTSLWFMRHGFHTAWLPFQMRKWRKPFEMFGGTM